MAVVFSNAYAIERQVVFGQDMQHGGFGGPSTKLTNIGSDFNVLMGGYGAWIVNGHFYLGGGGYGSVIELEGKNKNFSYGGVLVGSYWQPYKLVHYYADVLLGGGSLSYLSNSESGESQDQLYGIEPSVGIAINLSEFAKLNVGASYRHIMGSANDLLSNQDLSGASLAMSVMFGKF